MKKILVLGGMLWAVLSLNSMARAETRAASGNQSGTASPAPQESPGASMRDPEQRRVIQGLRQRIDELKASHQSRIDELQPVLARAVREKATETVRQIETIISRRQERYRNEVQPLEEELRQLQSTLKKSGATAETSRPTQREQGSLRSRKAPDFDLDSFDGRTFQLSDYKGSIVVLEWLNTDCPHVKYHYEQAKTMVNLAAKYRNENVVWLAINSTSQTTPEANREFTKKYGLPYPILDDRPGQIGRLYGARKTPHLFIIDRNGYLVYDGAIDNAPPDKPQAAGKKTNYVEKALTELLSGQKVSVPATPPYGTVVGYPAVRPPK